MRRRCREHCLALLALLMALQLPGAVSAQPGPGPATSQREPVLRLTFEYRDGRLALRSVQELQMVLPLPVKERVLKAGQRPVALALELQDAGGAALLQSEIDDPLELVSETRDPQDPDKIRRDEARQDSATFSVLVPAPAGAEKVRVTRPGRNDRALAQGGERAREELGTFELDRFKTATSQRPGGA